MRHATLHVTLTLLSTAGLLYRSPVCLDISVEKDISSYNLLLPSELV